MNEQKRYYCRVMLKIGVEKEWEISERVYYQLRLEIEKRNVSGHSIRLETLTGNVFITVNETILVEALWKTGNPLNDPDHYEDPTN